MSYSSVLTAGGTRDHLFASDPPRIDGDVLTWSDQRLACSMTLRRRSPRFERKLVDGVSWRCEMPAADAELHIEGKKVRGRGYAELLELTIAPWDLPIDELRWGRFCGDRLSLVWIDWRGSHPLTLVLLDGAAVDGSVSDRTIIAGDATLSIGDGAVIRSAAIGDSIPFLEPFLPKRMTAATEHKWCSRSTVSRGGQNVDRGWAVHEIVRFA
ncbi:MAG TPA: hypothetical protein VLV78_02005 [Thermoanaerobaculia bacterium]|nr:hypothetical protein [Thermoanaerobaculia bacterium]